MLSEEANTALVGSNHVQDIKERIKEMMSLESIGKDETLRLRLEHVGPSVALFFQENPLKIVKGSGQYLYDELGNEYLDCINNVSHVGHANRRVQEAVSRQLGLLNTNSRYLHDNLSLYAKRLTALFPAHLSVCYLVNSGSEANDLAIRLARAHTRRKDIVSLDGAYHGNLTSTMAISPYKTDKLIDHKQAKWAHVAPLPCQYRGPLSPRTGSAVGGGDSTDELGKVYADASSELIERVKSRGRQVAAFFVESMISCGGQTPLPSGYLRHLQRYLRAEGTLLVCDEVQTGFGRSGECMWAFQLDGADIRPDIVTVGKPMGNGFPVSAVITTPEIARAFKQIGTEYFNTFGGNAVSCAAAMAVLDELEERNLMEQARKIGAWILDELWTLKRSGSSQVMGDVRGCGFFIGVDIVESLESRKAAPQYAQYIVQRFREEHIIMSTEGKLGNVLKFKPPMCFNMSDARRFIQVLTKALTELELQFTRSSQRNNRNTDHKRSVSSACSSSSSASVSSSSWLESSTEQ